MASAFEGLYVEFEGNTAKFDNTVRGVNKALALLKKEFTTLNKELRFDPSNVEALESQLRNTEEALRINAVRAEKLRSELALMDAAGEGGTDKYINLQNSLAGAELRGKELNIQLDKVKQGLADANNPNSIVNLNRQLKDVKTELGLVDQRLKLDPSNVELAARKAELLEKATSLADQKVGQLKAQLNSVGDGDMGEASARELRVALDRAEIEAGQLREEINRVDNAMVEVDASSGRLRDTFIGGLGANVVASVIDRTVDAVADLSREAVTANDSLTKFESTMSFAGLDTSAIETARNAVKTYADETVYDLGTVANTTAQLAANGIKDYTGLTEAAGNLNAVAGGSADTFQSVAMVMTQTAGAGKLTTENWNQLADAIPGASGRLQEALLQAGAYTGNFREAMERGEITAEEFNDAVMQLGNEPIAVEAARSTKTFEGAIGNLQATVVTGMNNVIDAIGSENITSAITGLGETVSGAFEVMVNLINFIQDNSEVFTVLAIAVSAGAAAFAAYSIVQGIANAVNAFKLANDAATISQAALNAVMSLNPAYMIAAGIAALITVVIGATAAFGGATDAQKDFAQSSDETTESTEAAIDAYEQWKKKLDDGEVSVQTYREGIEGLRDAENALKDVEEELATEEEKTQVRRGRTGHAVRTETDRYRELQAQQEELTGVVEGYTNGTKDMTAELMAQSDATTRAKNLVAELGTNYDYTTEDLEGMGITMHDVRQAIADQSEEIVAANEALVEFGKEVQGFADTNPAFQQALENSGLSAEELAGRLDTLGIDFGEFSQAFDDCVRDITSGLDRIDTESQVSLENLMENLRVNAEATANWKDNSMRVFNAVPAELRPVVQDMINAGPDQFGLAMSQLAGLTDEEIVNMVSSMDGFTDSTTQSLTDLLMQTSSFGGLLADNLWLDTGRLNYAAIGEALATAGYDATAVANMSAGEIAAALGIPADAIDMSQLSASVESATANATVAAETGGGAIMQGTADGATANSGVVTTAVTGAVETAVAGVSVDMTAPGTQLMTTLAGGMTASSGAVSAAVMDVMQVVNSAVATTTLSPAGNQTMQTLASGITAGQVHVTTATTQVLMAITTLIQAENFTPLGLEAMTELKQGITSGQATVKTAAQTVGKAAVSALEESVAGAVAVGYNLSGGMSSGIYSGAWQVYTAARSVARQALEEAKREADVNSPARRWDKELGQMMGAGAAQGIEKSISEVENAASHLMAAAERSAKRGLERFSPDFNLGDFTATALISAMPGVAQTSQSSVTNITNNYTIDKMNYQEGSREAEAMELLADAQRIQRMKVRS